MQKFFCGELDESIE